MMMMILMMLMMMMTMMMINETRYDHSPEAVIENDQVKLLWDFRIQTDHHLDHCNRPDIQILESRP